MNINVHGKQIMGIQVIRGISALLILLYHYTSRYNDIDYVTPHANWPVNIPWGCYAVSTFFLISGFLTASDLVKGTSPVMFIKKRVNRLYPTFWAALIITYFVTLFFHQGNVRFLDLLVNFSMIPAVFGFEPVDGVYWTLQYELFFYVVISILLLIKNRKLIIASLVSWLLLSVVFYFLQNDINIHISKVIRVFGIIDYAAAFILGLAMGLFRHKYISNYLYVTIILISFVSFFLYKGAQSIFFAANYLLLQYVISNENCILNKDNIITKPFAWIAALSYPLYLIHQKIGYIIISNTIALTGYNGIATILLPFIVSLLIAYCLHRYVEINKSIKILN